MMKRGRIHSAAGNTSPPYTSAIMKKMPLPIGAAALALLAATPAPAQDAARDFPAKPMRIIVPFPPGGGNDIMARFIGVKLTERLGRQTVIENRPGADGIIGAEVAAKAPPDGHTLLIISVSYAMNAALHKLPYDPVKSFTPIAQIGHGPSVLIVTPTLPVNSVKQLIALARARPGQLNYASSGIGGVNHFSAELFKFATKTDMVHVPYKGGTPAMTDVMAGQVAVAFNALTSALVYIRTGKLKPLGVGSARRSPALPDVPPIAETVPGYEAIVWWGISGPAGIAQPIVAKLNTEINAILRDPATTRRLESEAAEAIITTPEAFGNMVASDVAKWIKVAAAAGIKTH
jgi:tripartite-type tricarboxylate transporter receptor subunit TctC